MIGVVRRNDAFAQGMFAVCVAGLAVALWVNRASPLHAAAALGAMAPLAVGFWLLGFSSRVVITPRELISLTPFHARRVPRQLTTGVAISTDGTLAVEVEDAEPLVIGAGVPVMWDRHRSQVRAVRRLESLLDAIPPEPGGLSATTPRYPLIALALAALAGLIATAATALVTAIT